MERKRTAAHLSENGAVHDGWGGRRMRNEKPEQSLGKLGTTTRACHVTGRRSPIPILDRKWARGNEDRRGRKKGRLRRKSQFCPRFVLSPRSDLLLIPVRRNDTTGNALMQIRFQTTSWIIQHDQRTLTGLNISRTTQAMSNPQNSQTLGAVLVAFWLLWRLFSRNRSC